MSEENTVTLSVPGGPSITMTDKQFKEMPGKIGKALRKSKSESAATPSADEGTPADVSGKRLKSFIERVERLEEEKAGLGEDIKEVYAEAKGTGFEPKIMRKIIKLRKMDTQKRTEEQELLMLYASAIGMQLELGV